MINNLSDKIILKILCEGLSEYEFVRICLAKYLENYNPQLKVEAMSIRFKKNESNNKNDGFGGFTYTHIRDQVKLILSSATHPIVFTTFIDLYQSENKGYGYGLYQQLTKLQKQTYDNANILVKAEILEQKLLVQIKQDLNCMQEIVQPSFIPYLHMQEFESLYFANPELFCSSSDGISILLHSIVKILEQFSSPEHINSELNPADRLEKSWIEAKIINKKFNKVTTAIDFANKLIENNLEHNMQSIRSCCKHFDNWLQKLEKIGV